jgi:hypothetical protein
MRQAKRELEEQIDRLREMHGELREELCAAEPLTGQLRRGLTESRRVAMQPVLMSSTGTPRYTASIVPEIERQLRDVKSSRRQFEEMQRDKSHIEARMGALGSELRDLHDIRLSYFPRDRAEVF